jgi:hypothetical protein
MKPWRFMFSHQHCQNRTQVPINSKPNIYNAYITDATSSIDALLVSSQHVLWQNPYHPKKRITISLQALLSFYQPINALDMRIKTTNF